MKVSELISQLQGYLALNPDTTVECVASGLGNTVFQKITGVRYPSRLVKNETDYTPAPFVALVYKKETP